MKLAKILCLLSMVIMLGSVLINCSSSDDTSTPEPSPIQTAPDFTGDIVEVHSMGENDVVGTILVVGEDVIQSSDKYIVTIMKETLILEQDSKYTNQISFIGLEPGQNVQIWFSGPVRESYPAQVDAAQVMIVNGQDADTATLDEEFQLAIGQRVEFSDTPLSILFKGVINDSRCAQDVTCVWQGEVSVNIEIISGDESNSMTLIQPGLFYEFSRDSYAGYEIAFKVLPYPEEGKQIQEDEYRLIMMVTKEVDRTTGTLRGHVTIGPIKPVVQPGDDPEDVPPEVYDARKIMVYDVSGKKLIAQVDIGHDGNYSVDLDAGTYLIDINNLGIDNSNEVPTTIELVSGESVTLDIDIDTGIR